MRIAALTLPADYSKWILQHVDPNKRSIVIEGHGSIPVTADGVTEVLGLLNRGDDVFYGCDPEATKFMMNLYGFEKGSAPNVTTFCKMIEDMKGRADDDFMRAWITLMVNCFLCPTTGLTISPRCYPIVVDLKRVKRMNFAKFVVDQIMKAVSEMGTKKKSVVCCVHHLVVR